MTSQSSKRLRRLRDPPLTPVERRAFDYSALEEAMAIWDAVVRKTRIALGAIAQSASGSEPL